tara:strand:- start:2919 stop:3050 length:132 start_codon:yes stop_codon:yes gene_type:complete
MIYVNYSTIFGCTGWVIKKPLPSPNFLNKTKSVTNKSNNYEKR